MKTFILESVIAGQDTEVIVQEPNPWNSNRFRISLKNTKLSSSLLLELRDGCWCAVDEHPISNNGLEQLEINSIGYKIARHWCQQLTQQLENFLLTF